MARDEDGGNVTVGRRCRQTAGIVVRAFVGLMEEATVDGWVSIDEIRRIGAAVMAGGGPLSSVYLKSENLCNASFALAAVERQRSEHLGRLLCGPIEALLDVPGGIERNQLPQLFAAMRMMLGEELYEELKNRSAELVELHRQVEGLVDWDAFHADSESKLVVERVLVTIARSFRRFEPRKDWFLIVMNSNPGSVSLGSSAFIPKRPEDKAAGAFSATHMVLLFETLFAGFRPETFDDARREAFVVRWGVPPEKIFGPLFVELMALAQQKGV